MFDFALLIDSMAIKQEIIYNTAQEKYVRFVNYGNILPKHSKNNTSEKLISILDGHKYSWKCPVGYTA